VEIKPEYSLRDETDAAVERHTRRIEALLPFAELAHMLEDAYAPHAQGDWTPTLASFTEVPTKEIPVGIQLVVTGGVNDRLFLKWRGLLRADPELLSRYNDFKLAHAGDDYEAYTDAKAGFIQGVLGTGLGEE
jgi:GrpB-like predicted nucleotidyltransferase (UPF0157 family)